MDRNPAAGGPTSTSALPRTTLPTISGAIALLLQPEEQRDYRSMPYVLAAARVMMKSDGRARSLFDLAKYDDPCMASVIEQLGGPTVLSAMPWDLRNRVTAVTAFLQLALAVGKMLATTASRAGHLPDKQVEPYIDWVEDVGMKDMIAGGFAEPLLDPSAAVPIRARLGVAEACAAILQFQLDLVGQIPGGTRTNPYHEALALLAFGTDRTSALLSLLTQCLLEPDRNAPPVPQGSVPTGLAALVIDVDSRVQRLAQESMLTSIADIPGLFSRWASPGRAPPSPRRSFRDLLPGVCLRGLPSTVRPHCEAGFDHIHMQHLVVSALQYVSGLALELRIPATFSLSVPGIIAITEAMCCQVHTTMEDTRVFDLLEFGVYFLNHKLTDSLEPWFSDPAPDDDAGLPAGLRAAVLPRLAAVLICTAEAAADAALLAHHVSRSVVLPFVCLVMESLVPFLQKGMIHGVLSAEDAAALISRAGRALGMAERLASTASDRQRVSTPYRMICTALSSVCVASPPQWLALRRDLTNVTLPAGRGGGNRAVSVLELLQMHCRQLLTKGGVTDVAVPFLGFLGSPQEKVQAANLMGTTADLKQLIESLTSRPMPLAPQTILNFSANILPCPSEAPRGPWNDSLWSLLLGKGRALSVDLSLLLRVFDSSTATHLAVTQPRTTVALLGPMILSLKISQLIDGALASDRCRRNCRSNIRADALRASKYVAKLEGWRGEARALRRWLLYEALPAAEAAEEEAGRRAKGSGESRESLGMDVRAFFAEFALGKG